MAETKKLTKILSIDGGGIRGVIPGQILVRLEEKLKTLDKNPDARIADYFDLIAGTSTGGILACLYLCPESSRSKRPRFSAQDAVDLYLDRGDDIFDVSLWHKLRSAGGLTDEKYPSDELEETLKDYFQDLTLRDLIKPCVITAYDVKRRRAHFFTQHDADQDRDNFLVRDITRATSAAPTFFEAARIKSFSNVTYPLIDGGVFANNPALCAYAEARKLNFGQNRNKPTAKDMAILSLSTGKVETAYYYKQVKDWGLVEWIKPLIDIMMSSGPETVDYQLRQIYDAIKKPKQYLRMTPKLRGASPAMDDASRENLQLLQEAGNKSAEEQDTELTAFARLLIRNK